MELIKIHEFLKLVEKHGEDELSAGCEVCVEIKEGMETIQTALKFYELSTKNIKTRHDPIMSIGLIPEIVEQMEILMKKAKRFGKTYINRQ